MSGDTPLITRYTRQRECYCSTCFDHRAWRKRRVRCGRGPMTDVWWTVEGSTIEYRRRKDAVAAAERMAVQA